MTSYYKTTRAIRIGQVSGLLGLGIVLAASLVLVGWATGSGLLKSVLPDLDSMKPNTAVCFILFGLGVWCRKPNPTRKHLDANRILGLSSAAVMGLIALLTLGQYLSGSNLGIDELLFNDPASAAPGRMAFLVAINFFLLAVVLLTLDWQTEHGHRPGLWLVLLVAANSFVAILGYIYGVEALYRVWAVNSIALHTAALFLVACGAVVVSRPESMFVQRIFGSGIAGVINRILLPAAIVLWPLIAWLRWQGELAGWYSTATGLALHAFSNVFLFAALAWWVARTVQLMQNEGQSFRRSARILHVLRDPVALLDEQLRIVHCNPAFEQAYAPSRDHGSQTRLFRAGAWDSEMLRAELTAVAEQGIELHDLEQQHPFVDGTTHVVLINAQRVQSEDEQEDLLLVSVSDVTERRAHEREVRGLNQKLLDQVDEVVDMNRELEGFSHTVAHDLRAPLRHIAAFAQRLSPLLVPLGNPKADHYISVISRSVARMAEMVDALLAYAQLGRTAIQRAPADMNALCAEAQAIADLSGGQQAILWQVGDLPAAEGDPTLIRLVWQNLLTNAAKFSSKSAQPTIEIGALPATPTTAATYYVRDNGVGFAMSSASRLFGLFQRLHTREQFPGTGIGLANVRRIVERHGGKIWADSALHEGATFYFTLVADAQSEEATKDELHGLSATDSAGGR